MSARARHEAGAAQRGDGGAGMDAGRDARGRATQERLSSARAEAARAAKARRNAWLLAGLAMFFYVGYIAWMFIRANGA